MSLLLDYTGEGGAPGRIRADTEPGLSRLPLLVGLRERNGPGGRTRTRTGSALNGVPLLLGYAGETGTPGRNLACNLRVRSAALYTLSYGSVENGAPGRFRPVCLRNVSAAICY